jgi:hypothetical protein
MANKYHADQQQIEAILVQIDADPEYYLNKTAPLTDADFAFMGRFIQSYCYADLNARRIIDYIRSAALGPDKKNAGILQDAQVFPKLREVAEMLPTGDLREGLIKAANLLEMQVVHRHQFAHWATRRIVGHNVLVMFTKNSREGEKRLGGKPEPDALTYGLVPLGPWSNELPILEANGRYLAEIAADIALDLSAYKKHFDEEKAADQAAKYEAGKYKKGANGPAVS